MGLPRPNARPRPASVNRKRTDSEMGEDAIGCPCCFCCCCFMNREADSAPMVVVKGVIETNCDARIASW